MTEQMKRLLRLDLQTFAENPEDATGGKEDETLDETLDGKESDKGGGDDVTPEENPEDEPDETPDEDKKFSQAELDRIVKERLDRKEKQAEKERERIRKESEKKSFEENEEYKKLADSYKEELDEIKKAIVDTSKEKALIKAGYSEDQIDRYLKYVGGETDDEISQSVEALVADVPPTPKRTYADPSTGNGQKGAPKKKDGEEVGKTMYDRIKNKIRK